jgi:hypothetical protein
MFACVVLLLVQVVGAQTPVTTVEDGALDRIELFVRSIESPANLTVVIRPFDASAADLGTGAIDGKETRQHLGGTVRRNIGEDIGKFLARWARGDSLK